MKKHTKLTVFILSLALLIGSVIGISASASISEEGALEIAAMNISYGDRTQVLIAVKVDNQYRNDVEVVYTLNGTACEALLHPTMTYSPEEGIVYPVFYTQGIPAKDMADAIKVEAHIGEVSEPLYYEASVATYFFTRLYKDDLINVDPADTENVRRRDLYLAALEYGAKAQDALVNTKNEVAGLEKEALVNTYVYAWSDDANVKVDGKNSFYAYAPETQITPVYVGDSEITAWTLLDVSGEVIGTAAYGEAVTLTAHTKLVPGATAVMDYENGMNSDYVNSYLSDGTLITDTYGTTSSGLYFGIGSEGDNKYLQVRNAANSNASGYTKVDISGANAGNCYVFETRINIAGTGTAGYNFANLKFVNNNGGEALNLYLKTTNPKNSEGTSIGEGFAVAVTGSNASLGAGTVLFDATDELIKKTNWFTLRVEFYFAGAGVASSENTYLKLYVNGNLVFDDLASWAVGANISHAEINHLATSKVHNVYYDDISFVRTDSAYSAN